MQKQWPVRRKVECKSSLFIWTTISFGFWKFSQGNLCAGQTKSSRRVL